MSTVDPYADDVEPIRQAMLKTPPELHPLPRAKSKSRHRDCDPPDTKWKSHRGCDHLDTKNERAKCRRRQGRLSPSQVEKAEPVETATPRGHKDCDHPRTQYEDSKCRERRLYPPVPSIATLTGRRKSHEDCDHPKTAWAQKLCREGRPQPSQSRDRRPPEETMTRVLAWVKRQTELQRSGYIGCLPTTTDAARALFPSGAIATVGKDGVVTSGGVVHGSKTMAIKYLSLLESEGLVQRHRMTHGIPTVHWSAVDNPTGEPVSPGVLDYYS